MTSVVTNPMMASRSRAALLRLTARRYPLRPPCRTSGAGSAAILAAMTDTFTSPISSAIDELWERRADLSPQDTEARENILPAVDLIGAGTARVAHVDDATDDVVVDERAKRAILLAFKVLEMDRS